MQQRVDVPPPGDPRALRLDPRELVPLPPHPDSGDVPWPTADSWPTAPPPGSTGDAAARADLDHLLERAFDPADPLATTYAVVIVQRGSIVAERYAGELPHLDRQPEPVGPATKLLSWSMAKSILHSLVGIVVGDGLLELGAPAPVPEWCGSDDPRRLITVEDLLEMRDGLDFAEDYVDAEASDVIEMLFGSGSDDVARYASGRPARWGAGLRFAYSSGTSNVLAGILRSVVGPGSVLQRFADERLFEPIGARSFELRPDASGTWVASSFAYATARDYARFGELQLRDGVWDGARLLPAGWVDHGRLPRSVDPDDGAWYGAHWWCVDDEHGTFRAAGYEGQAIVIVPGLDLVIVRLGKTPEEHQGDLHRWLDEVIEAFAAFR